jgi:hypothetical protein
LEGSTASTAFEKIVFAILFISCKENFSNVQTSERHMNFKIKSPLSQSLVFTPHLIKGAGSTSKKAPCFNTRCGVYSICPFCYINLINPLFALGKRVGL